jgi:hypothetical protein
MDGEKVLNPSTGEVFRATDPVITPQPYSTPGDFAAQYPTPLDPTEVIEMCEEISLLRYIPEIGTALKQHTWRELDELNFTSGSSYIAFADGACPEEYEHDGDNTTITLKNLGAKKTLSVSDIMHSIAVSRANWHGINTLVGPAPASEGRPGGSDTGTFEQQVVMGVKEKEVRLGMTLVMNGWDRLLVLGDTNSSALQFDGIEKWQTNMSCTFHTNDNSASGTFSATSFDRWLGEGCAIPTTLMGHPQSMQEVMSSYFQLGFQGSQVINYTDGNRLVPGFNFGGFINTGVGRLNVVADNNFTRTAAGSSIFQADIWAFRMTHNGEPLVYSMTQIPLSMKDLVPGCTAISFQIWVKTALVIKNCCMHGQYKSQFTGRIVSTCTSIG